MEESLKVGDKVRNPTKPEWGDGVIKSISGHKVIVRFNKDQETKTLRTDICPLERVSDTAKSKASAAAFDKFLKTVQQHLDAANTTSSKSEYEGLPGEQPQSKIESLNESIDGRATKIFRLGPTFDTAAIKTVLDLWRDAHELNIRLFVSRDTAMTLSYDSIEEMHAAGPQMLFSTFVFLIPDVPVFEIAEFAKIGTCNAEEDAWKETRAQLKAAQSRWDFEIVTARPDRVEGRFIKPLPNRRVALEIFERLPVGGFDISPEDAVKKHGFGVGWD
jgi:hypothetical protein